MIRKAAIICLLFVPPALFSKTIWQEKNLYATDANLQVGSIIVVNVNELSNMRFSMSLSSKNMSAISSSPDSTITGFLPKASSSKKINNDDKIELGGKGDIRFSMAARIANRTPQGQYGIAGSKTFNFHGVSNIITVTGLVDPVHVKGGTIDSRSIADLALEIREVKTGINITRPNVKAGEKLDTNLTEDEKQRIFIDYLQKIIRELTK